MNGRRTGKIAFSILLLMSAVSMIGAGYQNLPFVQAAPTITLNPISGVVGIIVAVSGSGFAAGDAGSYACLSGTPVFGAPTCTFSAGGIMSASFPVGAVTPGTYVVQVAGSTADSASATFTVQGPTISLTPPSGSAGTVVTITGTGFSTSDAGACTITPAVVATAPACTVTASGSLSGTSFTAGSVAAGTYTITVQGSTGDFAQTSFTVTIASPTIALNPISGLVGATVTISGSGFAPADAGACTITPAVVATAPACTLNSAGSLTAGGFTVGNVAAGTYTIRVQGSTGDFAQATFTVLGPTISLNPTSGRVGIVVTLSGSGFSTGDAGACTITPAVVATAPACTVTASGTLTASSFTVGNVPAGTYVITVTGLTGDFAQATFTVIGPSITLTPSSGPAGLVVTVNGNNFATGDAGACTITPAVVATAPACTVTASGTLTASSFTVGSVATGTYTITVTGITGDFVQASFTVSTASPTIALTPNSGPVGITVTVTGSGFAPADVGVCTITPAVVATAPACTVTASGTLTASSFTVGNVAAGTYTITVQGSTGDVAQASFTVQGPTITLNPTSGVIGTLVLVTGSGFSTSDAGACTITPASLATVPSCTINASGSLTSSSFTVGSVSGGTYVITVTGSTGDFAQATFTVVGPAITLNPSSGLAGISVTISGNNFATGDAGACASVTPVTVATVVSCTITASGTLTGSSFTVGSVATGTYTITVTGSTGDFAQAIFTVTSPTPFIALAPTSGPVSTVVTVTGSGFVPADAGSCAPITSTPLPDIVTLSSCTISSGGVVIGSFTVSSSAALGAHTIRVTGSTGDFAQTTFTVTSTAPTITLVPTSGPVSTVVTVTGSGFNTADAGSCAPITSTPLPDIVTLSSCTISSSGQVTGSFIVSSTAALGAHTIRVTGSTGDFAQTTFTVTAPTPTITVVPNSGPPGATVAVTGSGFNPADAGPCTPVTSTPLPDIVTSSSCSISSSGQVTASFTVSASAVFGAHIIIVTGSTGDLASAIFSVTATTPTITLIPNVASFGTTPTITITGSLFNTADAGACTVTTFPSSLATATACTISPSGTLTASSFTVSAVAPLGIYTVSVTGLTGDFAQTSFGIVTSASSVVITPPSGPRGTLVTVTGTLPSSTSTCSMSGTPVSSPTCSMTTVPGTSFIATFRVASTTPAQYTITVTGTGTGNFVLAIFTVTGPTVTLAPSSGRIGIFVTVSGTGFSGSDTSCTISGTGVTTPACSINSGTGTVTGSFVVASVQPGSYVITVTGNSGDVGQAIFTILSGPSITLTPAIGTPGTGVTVIGAGFLPAGSSCAITGTGVQNAACTLVQGTGTPSGSFTISNVAPGSYVITLSSSGGGSAQAVLTVTNPFTPTIIVNPSDGPGGTSVSVIGTGFRSIDATCQLTSTDPLLLVSPTCSVSGGKVTASFKVGGGATPGTSPTVKVTGNTGDSAQVTFTVDSAPVLAFNPASPQPPGTVIQVSLLQGRFSSADISCTISSIPTGLFSTSACVLQSNGLSLTGTFFTISASAPAGTYAITVKGNNGDSASGTFTVSAVTGLQLNPNQAVVGSTITFRATGFAPSDTGCIVQSQNGVTPDNLLIGSFSCSMSAGVATGSFVVGSLATSEKNWNVAVKGTPGNDIPVGVSASFTVLPQIVISPTTGTSGTVVGVTGTGFASTATSCTLGIAPNPSGAFSITGCGISGTTGHTSGSFTVGSAVAGLYVVSITDNIGKTAGGTFQVGTPSANITITPNVLLPGFSAGISGSGFNPQDTSCTITPSIFSSPTCSISSGIVAASVTVSPSTLPGLYVVTVTGNKGDFASNYLAVAAVTTQTTTTSSTSVITSATSTSTTSTTTGVSTSFSTTTLQTTGFSTWIFTSRTVTTIFGQTTTSVVATVTTSSIVTFSTGTTVTTTTTITHTFGQIIQPATQAGAYPDAVGVLALLSLAIPLFFRRLVS